MPQPNDSLPTGEVDVIDDDWDSSEAGIRSRLSSFREKEATPVVTDDKAKEIPDPNAKKPEEGETVITLGEDKSKESKPAGEAKSAEKVGKDNLTKSERAQVLEYKKKLEENEGKIKEYEERLTKSELAAKERDEARAKAKEWETKYGEKEKEHTTWLSKQDKIALAQVQRHEVVGEKIREFDDRRAKLEPALQSLCSGYSLDMKDIVQAHYIQNRAERNRKISEIKATFGDDDESKAELTSILQKLSDIDGEELELRREIRSNPQGALAAAQEIAEKRQKFLEERDAKRYSRAQELAWEYGIKEDFPLVEDKDIERWVKEKASTIDWKNLTPDKKAYLALSSFAATKYKEAYDKLKDQIARLEASVKKGSGSSLGPGGGNGADRPASGGKRRPTQEEEDLRSTEDVLTEWRKKQPQRLAEE